MVSPIIAQLENCAPQFQSALKGNKQAQGDLFCAINPTIIDLTRAMLRNLPEYIDGEDVVNQMWEDFLHTKRPLDLKKSETPVYQYVKGLIKNAIRKIAGKYARPGQKTRYTPEDHIGNETQRSPSGTFDRKFMPCVVSLDQEVSLESLPIISSYREIPSIQGEIDFALVVGMAPADIEEYLCLVHHDGWSKIDASEEVGMKRTTLNSKVKRFYDSARNQLNYALAS